MVKLSVIELALPALHGNEPHELAEGATPGGVGRHVEADGEQRDKVRPIARLAWVHFFIV